MKVRVITSMSEFHEDMINVWMNEYPIQTENIISITQIAREYTMTTTIFYKIIL